MRGSGATGTALVQGMRGVANIPFGTISIKSFCTPFAPSGPLRQERPAGAHALVQSGDLVLGEETLGHGVRWQLV